jgi:hypothetical protein
MIEARPFPVVASVTEMADGWRRVRALASEPRYVVPGHDPLVMQRYCAPNPSLEGIAVRLDAEPVLPFVLPFVLLGLDGCASVQSGVIDAASPYFDAKTLDLGRVLPPAPADDSETTRREIELMLRIRCARHDLSVRGRHR